MSTMDKQRNQKSTKILLGGGEGRWANKLTARFLHLTDLRAKENKSPRNATPSKPKNVEDEDYSKHPFFPMDEDLEDPVTHHEPQTREQEEEFESKFSEPSTPHSTRRIPLNISNFDPLH